MTFTKIQVIKILRDNIPGLGMMDAKNMVDEHELKRFENRVVQALGENARDELHQWALLYNLKRDKAYEDSEVKVKPLKAFKFLDNGTSEFYELTEDEPYRDVDMSYEPCNCDDCLRDRCNCDECLQDRGEY